MRYLISITICIWMVVHPCFSQKSAGYFDPHEKLELIRDLYDHQLFATAQQEIDWTLEKIRESDLETDHKTQIDLHFYKALCQLHLHPRNAEKPLLEFINEYGPDEKVSLAKFELGSYYYNQRKYNDAIDTYENIPVSILNEDQKGEYHFKFGYCLFVKKYFDRAKIQFEAIKNYQHSFYYPGQYYAGMCYYFEGNYTMASQKFDIAGRSGEYEPLVPYYLAQIYFSQNQYDLLITYVEQKLQDRNTEKRNELHQLLGQSYYEKGNYEKALRHLEYFEENTEKLSEEQFYQLAYTLYQTGNTVQAAEHFRKIAGSVTGISQNANYYLADCYLKTGDKSAALFPLRNASQMDFSPRLREEALFNYAKLSAELGFHSEAIGSLNKIDKGSPYFTESQEILSQLFLESNDFERVIQILKNLDELSPSMQKAYQQAHYAQGIRLFRQNRIDEAIPYLLESLNTPANKQFVAQALYWIADGKFRNGEYQNSLDDLDNYFYASEVVEQFDDQCAPYMAHYLKGYNHIRLDNYQKAQISFELAYSMIDREKLYIQNRIILDRIYPDAIVRSADCALKQQKYTKAESEYKTLARLKLGRSDYALYQLALIQGLQGESYKKNITLEELIEEYPDSEYFPRALLALGDSYVSLGNPARGSASYKQLIRLEDASTAIKNEGLLKLGLIHYNAGDLPSALNYYKTVFGNHPGPEDSQEALLAIEEIYLQDLGESEKYLAFLETIPGMELSNFSRDSITFRAASIQYNSKNYQSAVSLFSKYLDNYPNGYYQIDARYLRGESLTLLEKYSLALEDYEYLVDLGNNEYYTPSVHKAAIIHFNNEENFQKALQYYSLLEGLTRDAQVNYQASMGALRSALRIENRDKIMEFSDKITDHELATSEEKSFAYFCRGKALLDSDKADEALKQFEMAVSFSSSRYAAEANYRIGEILLNQGKPEMAEKQAQKAYQESTAYPYWVGKNVLLLSEIFISRDDLLSARAALEAIIENYTTEDDMLSEAKQKLEFVKNLQEQQNRIENPASQDTVVLEKNNVDND